MDSLRLILLLLGVCLLAGIYLWGVSVAKRGSRADASAASRPGDDEDIDSETLERMSDIRAVENVDDLKDEDVDIDEDLERELPPAREDLPEHFSVDDVMPERAKAPEPAPEPEPEPESEPEPAPAPAPPSEPRLKYKPAKESQLDFLADEKKAAGGDVKRTPAGKPDDASEQSLVLAVTVMAREGGRFDGGELKRWLEAMKLRHGEMGIFHYRPPGKPLRAPATFSVANVVKPGSFDPDLMPDITVPGVAFFLTLPGPDDPSAAFEEMLRTAKKLAEGMGGVLCDETRSTLTGQVINHMRERISEFSRRQRIRY